MWDHRYLSRIDFRTIPILLYLMCISLLVIAATTGRAADGMGEDIFLTPLVKSQLRWFCIGWVVYLFFAGFDYRYLKKWTWFLYIRHGSDAHRAFLCPCDSKCPSLVSDSRHQFCLSALRVCQAHHGDDLELLFGK